MGGRELLILIVIVPEQTYLRIMLKNLISSPTTPPNWISTSNLIIRTILREFIGKEPKDWLFPSYIDEIAQTTKNTSASAAANKRIRSVLGKDASTCHSLCLRNVECPKDIRDELGGWASSALDRHGSPADMKIKQRYL